MDCVQVLQTEACMHAKVVFEDYSGTTVDL